MELLGTIKHIFDEQRITDTFKKREMVLTTDEQYPQQIPIEFVQDKGNLLNAYQPGNRVKVSINIRGREWMPPEGETKYFVSIQGWRIENMEHQPMVQNGSPSQSSVSMPAANTYPDEPEISDDDLPF
jgi:single-stranded DNA-binding protein